MTKGKIAKELFLDGYNCAQAVFSAFAEDFGLSKDMAMKLSSGFGGGMGRLREVCGAVSGMVMVLNLKYGYTSSSNTDSKKQLYSHIQAVAKKFEEKVGSIVCRELLGLTDKKSEPTPENRTQSYYKKRPCAELVEIAGDIVEAYLQSIEC